MGQVKEAVTEPVHLIHRLWSDTGGNPITVHHSTLHRLTQLRPIASRTPDGSETEALMQTETPNI